MFNQKKIALMAQMAVYDKLYGDSDRKDFAFFRRDYIYRKNVWTRISVFVGAVILLGLSWFRRIFILGVDLQQLDIQDSVMESVIFLIAVVAVYTVIGTIIGTHEYYKIQKRMENYLDMLSRLEKFNQRPNTDPPEPGSRAVPPRSGESASVYRPRPGEASAPRPGMGSRPGIGASPSTASRPSMGSRPGTGSGVSGSRSVPPRRPSRPNR